MVDVLLNPHAPTYNGKTVVHDAAVALAHLCVMLDPAMPPRLR